MAKIKWVKKTELGAKRVEQEKIKAEKEKLKGKAFGTLSTKEKDSLLEM